MEIYGNTEERQFVENEPMKSIVDGIYYEVLDVRKRIFLIGFK